MRKRHILQLKDKALILGEQTLIMGILNVTPDSFSDGGEFSSKAEALSHALEMIEDGADIIDIGGESTRPGSKPVSEDEEINRVIPIIKDLRKATENPISIDTYKSKVAVAAIEAGANIINDISGGIFDSKMKELVAKSGLPFVMMHIKGTPRDMQKNPEYKDIIKEITEYFLDSIDNLNKAGAKREQIILDPGIGFGKQTEHNLEIMNRLDEFAELDLPILMGVSRKSVIGNVLDLPVDKRTFGTAATVTANIMKGAHIIRVHDVKEMRQVAKMTDAIVNTK